MFHPCRASLKKNKKNRSHIPVPSCNKRHCGTPCGHSSTCSSSASQHTPSPSLSMKIEHRFIRRVAHRVSPRASWCLNRRKQQLPPLVWYPSRKARNRLQHALSGNSVDAFLLPPGTQIFDSCSCQVAWLRWTSGAGCHRHDASRRLVSFLLRLCCPRCAELARHAPLSGLHFVSFTTRRGLSSSTASRSQ